MENYKMPSAYPDEQPDTKATDHTDYIEPHPAMLPEITAATVYPPSTDEWIAFLKTEWDKLRESDSHFDSQTAPICVGNVMELFARIKVERKRVEEIGERLAQVNETIKELKQSPIHGLEAPNAE